MESPIHSCNTPFHLRVTSHDTRFHYIILFTTSPGISLVSYIFRNCSSDSLRKSSREYLRTFAMNAFGDCYEKCSKNSSSSRIPLKLKTLSFGIFSKFYLRTFILNLRWISSVIAPMVSFENSPEILPCSA